MLDDEIAARAESLAVSLSGRFLGAVIVLTEDGTIAAWSDGAAELYGFTRDEVLGRSVLHTIVPTGAQDESWRQLVSVPDGAVEDTEGFRQHKSGEFIWADVTVRACRDEHAARFLVLNERDITRLKYRRDAQELQTRFRGALDAAPDAIVLVDEFGRITLVNAETERLFGYPRQELLGAAVEVLVPARFHAEHPKHRAKYFGDPQTRPMGIGLELSGRRKDGREFPVEISLSPLVVDGTRLAMAAIRDVTARRRTEEALKAANEDLESFTYSVSHDLRAPIRQIHGFTQMLVEQLGPSPDPRVQHCLRRIEEGTRHMGRLVDDLLQLAHFGRQELRPRSVSLGDVVTSVRAELQGELGERQVEWRVGELPVVQCDPGLIKVAVTNLLSNALKYTRPRDVAVIEIGEAVRNGRRGAYVRDNGVGFDMKYADKLFGVFQRLHNAEEFEGTGVGLATVQRVVHRHRGEIWAEATPGVGAMFAFTLDPTAPFAREAV